VRRRGGIKVILGCGLLGLLLAAGLAGGLLWRKRERERRWKWEPIVMPERVARVPKEWTVQTLAERLQKSRKVRDAATFMTAAQEVNLTKVAPGGYSLPAKAGPRELAETFKRGPGLVKITFPEGWTARQMARHLAANNFAGATEFNRLAYPADKPISPWEGRLFPDTYFLPQKGTAQQLMEPLNARFKEVTASLPKPFPRSANNHPLSLEEVVTLASLIERETHVPEERPIVAGVLLNRLRKGMRLQCDASVQYALQRAAAAKGNEQHQIVLLRDYQFPSPYNTYLNDGLPPGPICNPGEDSLRAAAAPQDTPYFFYVLSPKLDRHRFSVTYAEHQQNIELARSERKDQ
jgi:UPF0755 protein